LQAARAQWKELKAKGLELSYWQQGENGGWQKKA
jgi:DNA polymerase-3 subunit chi